jgi:uncharacterized protein YbjT (DUF2867 family)
VFVSYARADAAVVERLYDALAAAGHDVWIDARDLRPDEDWTTFVRRAIEGADAVIFVASPTALRSKFCLEELRQATQLGKPVHPVVLPELDSADLTDAVATEEPVVVDAVGDPMPELLRRMGDS